MKRKWTRRSGCGNDELAWKINDKSIHNKYKQNQQGVKLNVVFTNFFKEMWVRLDDVCVLAYTFSRTRLFYLGFSSHFPHCCCGCLFLNHLFYALRLACIFAEMRKTHGKGFTCHTHTQCPAWLFSPYLHELTLFKIWFRQCILKWLILTCVPAVWNDSFHLRCFFLMYLKVHQERHWLLHHTQEIHCISSLLKPTAIELKTTAVLYFSSFVWVSVLLVLFIYAKMSTLPSS